MDNDYRKYIEKKYFKESYRNVYMKFKKSKGAVKSVCAEFMALFLIEQPRLILEEDIDDFLNTIDLDSVWHLARESKNSHVKEIARDRIIQVLIDDQNRPIMEEKIEQDNVEIEKEQVLKKSI